MFSKCDVKMERSGVPCDCPLPTGTFNVPTQSIKVTNEQLSQISLPNFLVNVSYYKYTLNHYLQIEFDRLVHSARIFERGLTYWSELAGGPLLNNFMDGMIFNSQENICL